MSSLHQDPHWPRASGWAGADIEQPAGCLKIIGAPLRLGSITPGRCDLAPAAVRKALERYSPWDAAHNRSLGDLAVRDLGDLDVAGLSPEQALRPVRDAVEGALTGADAVILLGGDNSVTRPGALGLPNCGVITFDAHFDLRDLDRGLTNGNPIRALLADGVPGTRIAQIGIQSFANSKAYGDVARAAGITYFTAELVRSRGIEEVVAEALALMGDAPVYVDLDLDVLDRAFAPASPGSRPGGLSPAEVRAAARLCGAHPSVRVIDFVEIDPEMDVRDATSLAAAACLLEFAAGVRERCSR